MWTLQASATKSSHSDTHLQTLKYPDELESQVDKIRSEARLAEQEAGISTLFLAMGFLEWYDSETTEKPCFAPLLLLPVRVEEAKSRGKKVFYLSARDDAAESNISLQKLLATDRFGRTLPVFGSEDDEANRESIESYFSRVRESVEGLHRWQVRRWLVLGHFAFNRIAIYEDTRAERWQSHPVANTLVRSLLSGFEKESAATNLGLAAPDYEIDSTEIERLVPILIQDADASQHSALVDVMKGKNLVIHGPPGTGKSQTITNVIANVLGAGKSVLFLAEKLAALEVVKRRLDRSGLGEFCLELHSDKSTPRSVVTSLEQRAQLAEERGRAERSEDPAWSRARHVLSEYASALNLDTGSGTTPFGSIWQALKTPQSQLSETTANIDLPEDLLRDPSRLGNARGRMAIFASLYGPFCDAYGSPSKSPWSLLDLPDLGRMQQQRLVRILRSLADCLAEQTRLLDAAGAIGFAGRDGPLAVQRLLVELSPNVHEATVAALAQLNLADLSSGLTLLRSIEALDEQIAAIERGKPVASEVLDRAVELAREDIERRLLGLDPVDLFAYLDGRIAAAQASLSALDAMRPLMSLLSLSDNASAATIDAVAVATLFATKVPVHLRRWVVSSVSEDPRYISLLNDMGRLVEEEDVLRSVVSTTAPWPALQDIEDAAEAFGRSALSRFVGGLGRQQRQAAELVLRLGLEGGKEKRAAVLQRLAAHVSAINEYRRDPRGNALFGSAWAGVEMPFADINEGGILRTSFLERLKTVAQVGDTAQRLFELSDNSWNEVSRDKAAAEAWQRLESRTDVTALTVSGARAFWHHQAEQAQSALSLDPDRLIASQSLPIGKLIELADLRSKRDAAERTIALSPDVGQLRLLGTGRDGIDRLELAARWLVAISAETIPAQARQRLIGSEGQQTRQELSEISARFELLRLNESELHAQLEKEFGVAVFRSLDPTKRADLLTKLAEHVDELAEYSTLLNEAGALDEFGLADFVDWAWETSLDSNALLSTFNHLVAQRSAERALSNSAILGRASGNVLDAQRRTFVDHDRQRIQKARAQLRARLISIAPPSGVRQGSTKQLTDMGLLARLFTQQRFRTHVREIMSRAGDAVRALKPCAMMSPLSLAKYLPAREGQYDVLIIDEASQMRPEDALGAMLRARQIVVVGDQKQLPPTNFFDRNTENKSDDDDDFDEVDDESILERCQKVFGNVRQLKWHYRSRCESLIRFSNERFYDRRLITFPAPRRDSFSVDLVRVNGGYQARRNVAEAERVAEEAIRFMRAHAELSTEDLPTLGIVSVNTDQRELIRETINRYETDDELVARYREKAEQKGEEVFVKNLENVQGDERDYIFISLTYGPAPGATAVAQRFGPINTKQGHRRLNVLFSRARQRVILFSSMGSGDIRADEGANEGVVRLKEYLEYAEQRGRMPHQQIHGEVESDFEDAVAERLFRHGYKVAPQVGVSGFRVDLGVLHPDGHGRFLAGIECDGAAYHSSKSARDRDRLRQEILEGLGWTILRVWSTDWFANPEGEVLKLVKRLDALRSQPTFKYEPFAPQSLQTVATTTEPQEEDVAAEDATTGASVGGPSDGSISDSSASLEVVGTLPESAQVDLGALLDGDASLSEADAYRVLEYFRDRVIGNEGGDLHRSILRDGMIETFIRQRITDPEDWFTRVPQFQRAATDPLEKNKYLEQICEIITRLDQSQPTVGSNSVRAAALPAAPPATATVPSSQTDGRAGEYVATKLQDATLVDENRLYSSDYAESLRAMVDAIVSTEGPVFADVIATRIARAHHKERTGAIIRGLAAAATNPSYKRTMEGDREIVWPTTLSPENLVPFRSSSPDIRSYDDIPEAELGSLAVPYLALRMSDEAILEKFAEHFQLRRLRQPSRVRFLRAIARARATTSAV